MTLITRVSRLFKADIHGILDCIEEPHAILKQATREMSEEIAKGEGRLKQLESEQKSTANKQHEVSKTEKELDRQIGICFDQENEELARSFVKKRLEAKRRQAVLEQQAEKQSEETSRLREQISRQKEEFKKITEKMELFADTSASSAFSEPGSDWVADTLRVTEDDVEIAFLEEKQRRENREEG